MYPSNANKNKVQLIMLMSDKVDFKAKNNTGDNESYFMVIKGHKIIMKYIIKIT